MNRDRLVALVAAIAAAVLPVLVHDGVLHGALADVFGVIVGTFVVGYHVPSVASQVKDKQPPAA